MGKELVILNSLELLFEPSELKGGYFRLEREISSYSYRTTDSENVAIDKLNDYNIKILIELSKKE